ncbi:hypothetical protein BHM03_00019358 [Ensete ventricosum]|nr:hypothetical protein BHM03_00019358 [Ensete ventricosum]
MERAPLTKCGPPPIVSHLYLIADDSIFTSYVRCCQHPLPAAKDQSLARLTRFFYLLPLLGTLLPLALTRSLHLLQGPELSTINSYSRMSAPTPVLPSRISVNRLHGLANAATKAHHLPASSSTSIAEERTVVHRGDLVEAFHSTKQWWVACCRSCHRRCISGSPCLGPDRFRDLGSIVGEFLPPLVFLPITSSLGETLRSSSHQAKFLITPVEERFPYSS